MDVIWEIQNRMLKIIGFSMVDQVLLMLLMSRINLFWALSQHWMLWHVFLLVQEKFYMFPLEWKYFFRSFGAKLKSIERDCIQQSLHKNRHCARSSIIHFLLLCISNWVNYKLSNYSDNNEDETLLLFDRTLNFIFSSIFLSLFSLQSFARCRKEACFLSSLFPLMFLVQLIHSKMSSFSCFQFSFQHCKVYNVKRVVNTKLNSDEKMLTLRGVSRKVHLLWL